MSDSKIGGGGGFNIMSILDPAGLLSGLGGLMGGGGAQGANSSNPITQIGQSVLGLIGQGVNMFGAHDATAAGGASDPAQQPATTETGRADAAATQGYAQTAAKKLTEEDKQHLRTVMAYFSDADGQGLQPKDGVFDRDNLLSIGTDRYWLEHNPDLQQAAAYLLNKPELLNDLIFASGKGNGLVSLEGVAAYYQAGTSVASAPPTPPPAANNADTTAPGTPSLKPPPNKESATSADLRRQYSRDDIDALLDTAKDHVKQTVQQQSNVGGSSSGSSGSFGSGLNAVGANLATLMKQLDAAEAAALSGSPEAQMEANRLGRQFQFAMQSYNQMCTLHSDIMRSFHDMQMNTIRNIK